MIYTPLISFSRHPAQAPSTFNIQYSLTHRDIHPTNKSSIHRLTDSQYWFQMDPPESQMSPSTIYFSAGSICEHELLYCYLNIFLAFCKNWNLLIFFSWPFHVIGHLFWRSMYGGKSSGSHFVMMSFSHSQNCQSPWKLNKAFQSLHWSIDSKVVWWFTLVTFSCISSTLHARWRCCIRLTGKLCFSFQPGSFNSKDDLECRRRVTRGCVCCNLWMEFTLDCVGCNQQL